MTVLLIVLAVIAFFGWLYYQRKSGTGLPTGTIVYDDAGRHDLDRPLVSHRYGLVGKPDYLIETEDGLVPVELKSANCPHPGPYESHIAQLTAHCVLVEDVLGKRGPYGMLQYADTQRRIPYSEAERRQLLQLTDEIRLCWEARDAHRDHCQAGRCRGCEYRAVCGEALA